MVGGIFFYWFRKDADMLAGIEAGDDNTLAVLGQKCRGKTLVASTARALEWIEAHCVNRLNAFLDAALDVGEIYLELAAEFLQVDEVACDVRERVLDMFCANADEEPAELQVHPDDGAEEDQNGHNENSDGREERV